MGGITSVSAGHDPRYYIQQALKRLERRESAKYYSAAAKAQGGMEPEGRWGGRGSAALGLEPTSVVDATTFIELYESFTDPRDGSRFGRKPMNFTKSAMARAEKWIALEPDATEERKGELRAAARAEGKHAVTFWDTTFSPDKSITLLRASYSANALAARESGDDAAAGYWQDAAEMVREAERLGNAAMLEYLQDHAGFTRSGYNGIRQDDAHDWIIASWEQSTSRAGDPQDHIHNTILAHVVRERDCAVRSIDGSMIYEQIGAANAVGVEVMENMLTRDLGVQWVRREDGHGREIKGVSQGLMDMFSKRSRQEIDARMLELTAQYKADYGKDPDERVTASLRQRATEESRAPKTSSEPDDLEKYIRDWAAEARASENGALEPLGPAVSNRKGPGEPQAEPGEPGEPGPRGPVLTAGQAYRAMAGALEAVQGKQAAWTRAQLQREIGERLPAHMGVMTDAEAAGLLPALTDRVLAGETGRVLMLEAPEMVSPPDSLRRQDGESVFVKHQAQRYATESQLSMEERILAMASCRGPDVPRMDPELAAELTGSTVAQLQAQLEPGAQPDVTTITGNGLHLDQGAVMYHIMTSDRRLEIVEGAAGVGKSHTQSAMAKAWTAGTGGKAFALTPTEQAARVLRAMGMEAWNVDYWLCHRELHDFGPNAHAFFDEKQMIPMPKIEAALRILEAKNASASGWGDTRQNDAVENGGGMAMTARHLGYKQLTEALRFRDEWQREASIRFRAGDVSVLAEYDRRGMLHSGTREEMLEACYRGWLADCLTGKHSVMAAGTQANADELSRRARADLIHYGRVSADGEVPLRADAFASAGDRIMARDNDHQQYVGVLGRGLSNRDVLEVIRTDGGESGRDVEVRLLLGRGNEGVEQWGDTFTLERDYLQKETHLAYGITGHSAGGSTYDDNTYGLITPSDKLAQAYTIISRSKGANHLHVVTEKDLPDEYGAPEADPEIDRAEMLARERAGEVADRTGARVAGDAVTVLTQIMRRDDETLSATDRQARAYSDADHLAVIGAIFDDVAGQVARARYTEILQAELPEDLAKDAADDAASAWLFRSLREAEAAGKDGGQVLAVAIRSRPLTGARDVARVLDTRVRQVTQGLQPQTARTWADRVPQSGDPDLIEYLRGLAGLADARTVRLAEHTAETAPVWAVRTAGPVSDDALERADWLDKVQAAAAYRERWDYQHPGDPLGPEPPKTMPDARAEWHAARAALDIGGKDEDLSGVPDQILEIRRGLYERETAEWPEDVSEEARLSRLMEAEAEQSIIRSRFEAEAAADQDTRARHEANGAKFEQMRDKSVRLRTIYERGEAARRDSVELSESTLRMSRAADAELRARWPERVFEPLKAADPASSLLEAEAQAEAQTEEQAEVQGHLPNMPQPQQPEEPVQREGEQPKILSRQEQDRLRLEAMGLTRDKAADPLPEHAMRIAAAAAAKAEELAILRGMQEPDEDPDLSPTDAWALATGRTRDAVTQEPEVLVSAAPQVREPQAEHGGPEIGD